LKRLLFALALIASMMTATPASADTSDIRAIVVQAAYEQGAPVQLMLCLAQHESGFDPSATHYYNDGSTDAGLFQYHHMWDGSWSVLDETPWAGLSPYNATVSARAAAWAVAHGMGPRWTGTWWMCA
jgi:hypothetical protein